MPPIDLVTDFISAFARRCRPRSARAGRDARSCRCPYRTVCRDRCCPAEWSARRSPRCPGPPCVMPTVEASTLAQPWNGSVSLTSSAGQTCAGGRRVADRDGNCIRAGQRAVADGERQRVRAGRGKRCIGRRRCAAENVTPAAGPRSTDKSTTRPDHRPLPSPRATPSRSAAPSLASVPALTVGAAFVAGGAGGGGSSPPPPPPPPHAARTNSALTEERILIPRMEKFPLSEERRHPAR